MLPHNYAIKHLITDVINSHIELVLIHFISPQNEIMYQQLTLIIITKSRHLYSP